MVVHDKDDACYIFTLDDSEKKMIHTNSGMVQVQLRVLKEINGAFYTRVPEEILNPSIERSCEGFHPAAHVGHDHHYYLVH